MLRAPLLKHLNRVRGIDVWLVDGSWVRDQLDIDFTNGAHHLVSEYVPDHNIWLDREAPGADDLKFWELRQFAEHQLMSRGERYSLAFDGARKQEIEARKGSGGSRDQELYRRRLGATDGREVWLVNGRWVRDQRYVDFTLGGHGYRYPFIPKREIWLDDALVRREYAPTLVHEAVEIRRMKGGMSYHAAHALANREEIRFRRGLRSPEIRSLGIPSM